MKTSKSLLQLRRQGQLSFLSVLMVCLTLIGCSGTTTSGNANANNGDLEAQVLEIIRKNPQVIVESVQAYQEQQQQEIEAARQKVLQQMQTSPKVVIGDSPTTGAAAQNIVLIEFSDFQCPFCAKAHETVKQFMDKHKNTVTLAYKHLPLTAIHPEALPAAKASWAAGQQGKFWEYHDALFTEQEKLGEEFYVQVAQRLNLDINRFNEDRQSAAADSAVEKDVQLARALGIGGTPFFILNGETLSGAVELSEMEAALNRVVSGNQN